MFDIATTTEDQFLRQETFNAVKAEALDLIDHLMTPEARKLAEQIEDKLRVFPNLRLQSPEIYRQYAKLIVWLKITAIPSLDDDTVLRAVKFCFMDSFDAGLDLNDRMTGKMYSIPDLIWPDFALKLIGALKENTQKLGGQMITVSGETSAAPPTISNWLSDYDRTMGPEKHSPAQQQDYLFSNQNATRLNQQERAKLTNLIKFYNALKPFSIKAITETIKKMGLAEELGIESEGDEPIQEIPRPSAFLQQAYEQENSETEAPPVNASPEPASSNQSQPRAPQPPPRPAVQPPRQTQASDSYREPVAEQDLAGPIKPAPPALKPGPRMQGNVVDLKDIGK